MRPREQVTTTFTPEGDDTGADTDVGHVDIKIQGTWSETILYEIPMLALTSEAYFLFMDKDWTYDGQEDRAFEKGQQLLEAGCTFSEFGTRRRRDYHTQALVFRGLVRADKQAEARGFKARLSGTSNVHLAMRFGIPPVGTVAHEWFMGIAAITDDYRGATEAALRYWVGAFGGKLGIALTDTFGTQEFLRAFSRPVDPVDGDAGDYKKADGSIKTYAELFAGVRQDSGDPTEYVEMLRKYYADQGITGKTMVFSDSLNIERCLEYKKISEAAGFVPTFGVGTFLTNDFTRLKDGSKSTPLNIVIKLSSAAGRNAIKIRSVFFRPLSCPGANLGAVTTRVRTQVIRAPWRRSSRSSATWSASGRAAMRRRDGARMTPSLDAAAYMPAERQTRVLRATTAPYALCLGAEASSDLVIAALAVAFIDQASTAHSRRKRLLIHRTESAPLGRVASFPWWLRSVSRSSEIRQPVRMLSSVSWRETKARPINPQNLSYLSVSSSMEYLQTGLYQTAGKVVELGPFLRSGTDTML